MKTLGRHLLVELYGGDSGALDDLERVRAAMLAAAEAVGAERVGEKFHRFAPHGVSGTVVIAESHLSIHTWPEHGYAAMDIFTCGGLDPRPSIAVLQAALRASEVRAREIIRGLPEDLEHATLRPDDVTLIAHDLDEAARPAAGTVRRHTKPPPRDRSGAIGGALAHPFDRSDPDRRLHEYREAALQMVEGRFDVEVPLTPPDEIASLGEALVDLGHMLERKFTEQRQIRLVSDQVAAGLLLDDVCERIYETFGELIPYDRIGLALLEDEGRVLRARWARSNGQVKLPVGYSAPMAGSSLQAILETGRPRILNDLLAYLEANPESASTRLIVDEGIRSSLTCPLLIQGKAVGFVFFSSRLAGTYARAHIDIFVQIAGQLASIIEKSRLYGELLALNATRNRFLGMAAHDLRTPLTVILGYLELLTDDAELSQQSLHMLQRVEDASQQMLMLVEDLLDVSVIASGQLTLEETELDLGELLADYLETAELSASRKGIRVELEREVAAAPVRGDPRRLNQVLQNLIGNAVKYSPEGSLVRLTLRASEGGFSVSVRDRGVGIPEDEQGKLFAPFARVSSRPTSGESSTGLGLAITRRVLEAHGGRIRVESAPEQGSTFTFELPAAGARPPAPL